MNLFSLKSRGLRVAGVLAVLAFVLAPTAAAQQPLSFSKSFSPSTIGPGSVSTLVFAISNTGSTGVRNPAFSDTLPAGVTIATPAAVANQCGGTVSAPDGGSTISFSSTGIGGSTTCTIRVNVTASAAGTYTNVSGDLTSDAGNAGSATATLTVATDRPGFSKSFSPSSVFFGGRSTMTLTIDNSANGNQASLLSFTDSLPSGMVVASPNNASTTCSGGVLTAVAGSSTVSYAPLFFPDASVAAGATCTVRVDVVANSTGELDNVTGELSSNSTGQTVSSGKATAALSVAVQQLSIEKSFTNDPVAPGGQVNLSFTIRNLDRRSSASNISFSDDLDAVLSGLAVAGSLPTNPCGSGSSLSGSSVLSLTGGSLAAGASCTFSVTLDVPSGAASGEYTNTTTAVNADVGGNNVDGNAASDVLFVAPVPVLTKSFIDDPVGGGGTVTLRFTITNGSATSAATDITFTDDFDSILPTASSVPANGSCGGSSTFTYQPLIMGTSVIPARLTVAGASLPAGGSCTFDLVLDVLVGAPAGTYTNTTSAVTATVDGKTVTGDAASDGLEVVRGPVLSKEFIDDPAEPGGTTTLRFTMVLDEDSPADATGITFTDDLTATLSGLAASGLPANDVCGIGSQLSGTTNLSFTGGVLSPGETCSFDVTLQVPASAAAGVHTNTTSSVVSSVLGVSTTSGAASDDLRVAGIALTKEFIDDPARPGGQVTLRFTLENMNPTEDATDISFSDNLSNALSNLAASSTSVPQSDVCGTGSSLVGLSGNRLLAFTGGSLAAGTTCSFDVVLDVPSGAAPDFYANTTSAVTATFGGSAAVFDAASDVLEVNSDFLALDKEFIDDPVAPGDTATLRFTLTNLDSGAAANNVAFTDDLDAALSGLTSVSGTLTAICGASSQLTGTSTLSFTGGTLAAGGSCSFDVMVAVPGDVTLGEVGNNVTSSVTGTIGGLPVTGDAASDDLQIQFVTFSKSFAGPVDAGDTVSLTFSIHNLNSSLGLSGITFFDDLSAVLSGLTAVGLPANDVCGSGSTLSGTTMIVLDGASLLPGGSCTFSVTLQVPSGAAAGDYLNVTSDLRQSDGPLAGAASATLTVLEVVDSDGDGVLDDVDVCPDTVIPEGVPTNRLGVNRWALVDGDGIFDTTLPNGNGPGLSFTIEDTAGCSCEQIIAAQGLGKGHIKFGCSISAMQDWIALVHP